MAGFAPVAMRANGVSIWTRQRRWPDQPFVRGERSLRRIEGFFADAAIAFDAREPVSTKADGQ